MGSAVIAASALTLTVLIVGVPVIAAVSEPRDLDGACGPGGTAQTVLDQHLDAEQMANAAAIVRVVEQRGLPQRASVIAQATSYQESKFVNFMQPTDGTTSIGLFAQMTIYYGADVAADPVKATGAFLDRLVQQPNWQTRPLTDVAADVQKPYGPYRGLYAQWEPLATALTAQLWTGSPANTTGTEITAGETAPPAALPGVEQPGVPCPGSGGDGSNPSDPASPTSGPSGLTLTGSTNGDAAVTFAMAQIGEPYLWGGTGPSAWDCSGLMMGAWASVGVAIPRVTYTQVSAGSPVSIAAARSGDLVLIPGSDGTAANPGHVGMVAGTDAAGKVWLIEAPRTGLVVRLTPISAWAGQIVSIRRVG